MIAKVETKKCPFRKTYLADGVETRSQYQDMAFGYITEFDECYEKECMAWGAKEKTCLLCRKEEVKEQ